MQKKRKKISEKCYSYTRKNESTETSCEKTPTSDLIDKNFKAAIVNMFKNEKKQ